MAAAVAAFRPVNRTEEKIKKETAALNLEMQRTTDILKTLSQDRPAVLIGFAAETGHGLENARAKMVDKDLDLIVFNNITTPGAGFSSDTTVVTLVCADGREESLPMQSKNYVADRVLDEVAELLKDRKALPD